MDNISFDFSNSGISREEILAYQEKITTVHSHLFDQSLGDGQYLGWTTAPTENLQTIDRINETAEKIKQNSEALVVIGIGGSYLGAKAVIEACRGNFYNVVAAEDKQLEVYFAGQNLNSNYLFDLLKLVKEKNFSIIVISKSGTTLEPAVTFRFFREILNDKYGPDEAKQRIYVITDEEQGVLHNIAAEQGYTTFPVPRNVGGRYSVLTPVGLLPIAAAGIDIAELLQGAKDQAESLQNMNLDQNIAYQYAVARNILYQKGKLIELLVNYEPKLTFFGEWWKQLFGESEGKDGKALFPSNLNYTTDLHSMGQYVQEGPKNLFETVVNVDLPFRYLTVSENDYQDGLGYLQGKTLDFINKQAMSGTIKAHTEGGIPNLIFNMPVLSCYYLGKLLFTMETACASSAYLLGVNPFDQPGVEAYKNKMFELLRG